MGRSSRGFFGREDERARLASLLSEDARLVTVLGPAGIGKTRLAQEVTADLRKTGFHVVRCDLEPLRDQQSLVGALARAAGVALTGDDGVEALAAALARREDVVLCIDDAERAATPLAGVVASLIEATDALRVLVTSQVRLHLFEEVLFELGEVPEAVGAQIFEATARRTVPGVRLDPALVAAVVRSLEGLPLAIELAATRLRYRSLAELAAPDALGLETLFRGDRDLPARRRSLRGAIEVSWRAMEPEHRTVSRRLSVFAGGFRADDVACVVTDGPPEQMLAALRDRSLLWARPQRERLRFGLFDSLRRYVADAPGEDLAPWHRRHAEHFVVQGLGQVEAYFGPDPAGARAWIADEQDNLQIAAERMREVDPAVCADLVRALFPRIAFVGPLGPHRALLRMGVEAAQAAGDGVRYADAALALAWSHVVRGEFEEVEHWVACAREVAPPGTRPGLEAEVLGIHVALRRDGRVAAGERLQDCLRAAEAAGWVNVIGQVRLQQTLHLMLTDPGAAQRASRALVGWASRERRERLGYLARYFEGRAAIAAGDLRGARAVLETSAEGFAAIDEPVYAGFARAELARAHHLEGRSADALQITKAGLQSAAACGDACAVAVLGLFEAELLVDLDRGREVQVNLPELSAAVTVLEVPDLAARLEAVEARLGACTSASVLIGADGASFVKDGARVDLRRRGPARRILARLAQAHGAGTEPPLLWEQLCTAGWPDADPDDPGARNRTYTAIWTLRRLGLEGHIETIDDGYRLTRVELESPPPTTTATARYASRI